MTYIGADRETKDRASEHMGLVHPPSSVIIPTRGLSCHNQQDVPRHARMTQDTQRIDPDVSATPTDALTGHPLSTTPGCIQRVLSDAWLLFFSALYTPALFSADYELRPNRTVPEVDVSVDERMNTPVSGNFPKLSAGSVFAKPWTCWYCKHTNPGDAMYCTRRYGYLNRYHCHGWKVHSDLRTLWDEAGLGWQPFHIDNVVLGLYIRGNV